MADLKMDKSTKSLRESANELTPIDNLYDENERLRAEVTLRLEQIDGWKARLRASDQENERLRAAARLPDPVYRSQDGRMCCVYCGSIEEDGHLENCPWLKLNVVLSRTYQT